MIDPISALSVAAAIVQFLDFSCKVVGTAFEVHKSATGATEKNLEIAVVASDLEELSNRLQRAATTSNLGWIEGEKEMQEMARRCHSTAKALLSDVHSLQKTGNARYQTWEAIQVAVRTLRKKGDIEIMQRSLDRMRAQLTLHLTNVLQKQHSSVVMSVEELTATTKSFQDDLVRELHCNQRELLALLHSLTGNLEVAKLEKYRRDLLSDLHDLTEELRQVDLVGYALAAFRALLLSAGLRTGLADEFKDELKHARHLNINDLDLSHQPGNETGSLTRLRAALDPLQPVAPRAPSHARTIDPSTIKQDPPIKVAFVNMVKASSRELQARLEPIPAVQQPEPTSVVKKPDPRLKVYQLEPDLVVKPKPPLMAKQPPRMSPTMSRLRGCLATVLDDPLPLLEAIMQDLQAAAIVSSAESTPDQSQESSSSTLAGQLRQISQRLMTTLDRLSIYTAEALQHCATPPVTAISKIGQSLQAKLKIFFSHRFHGLGDGLLFLLQDMKKSNAATFQLTMQANDRLSAKIEAMCQSAAMLSTSQAITNSLRYEEMSMRYVQIPEAYADTNEWILEHEESPFRAWLETGNGVFWINGKAGSGKSTMMKFLADNPRTPQRLKIWAESDSVTKVTLASHYFWKAGYPMQASLTGLLQFLLYHVLRECPTLIPAACPTRWQKDHTFHMRPDPWTQRELSAAIDVLLRTQSWPSKFCFFIDGLDEYLGTAADQYQMVQDLHRLASCPFVKICVSSRPWNVFRTAYGARDDRMLVLQDHNKSDLDIYISGKLESDMRFQNLAATHEEAKSFVTEIRDSAGGVFLWVFLVVRSLLDGLTEDDDISMLQRRLRAIPKSLEEYFEHMLKSIDPIYKRYTARALLLACAAVEPLPVLSFHYLEMEMADGDYALTLPIQPLLTAATIRNGVAARLNKWCRDLLEVTGQWRTNTKHVVSANDKVQFLHRTAYDYLLNDTAQGLFLTDAGVDFDAQLSLCRSYLAQCKSMMRTSLGGPPLDLFFSHAGYVLHHAKQREAMREVSSFEILQELDHVGGKIAYVFSGEHWTYACPRFGDVSHSLRQSNFLSYAIEFDLRLYVEQVLKRDPEALTKLGAPLLEYAIRPSVRHAVFLDRQETLHAMVTLLIRLGAAVDSAFVNAPEDVSKGYKTGSSNARAIVVNGSRQVAWCAPASELVHGRQKEFEDDYRAHLDEVYDQLDNVAPLGTSTPSHSYMQQAARGEFRALRNGGMRSHNVEDQFKKQRAIP